MRLAALALCAGAAHAQVSGNASVVSDYRYRGVSLSDERPALQGSLAYDDPSGWYAGVFASSVRFHDTSGTGVQAIPFVGVAKRIESGWSFEVGANATITRGPRDYDYQEIYAGLALRNLSARVYWSPRYYGLPAQSFYAEVNGALPLGDRVRLLGHAGVLERDRINSYAPRPDSLYDAQLGIGVDFDAFNVQLALVAIGPADAAYAVSTTQRRNTVVLTLSHSF
jgi:uncharacterized protein (TIGR02001 family)